MAELWDKLFPRGPKVALQWDFGRSNRPEERQGGGMPTLHWRRGSLSYSAGQSGHTDQGFVVTRTIELL